MDKEKRIKQLRGILKKAKIYDPKLEPQIALTVRIESQIERIENELDNSDVIIVEISASGTEKNVASPLIILLHKFDVALQSSYASLGLNYDINPRRIHDARSDGRSSDGIDNFMSNII